MIQGCKSGVLREQAGGCSTDEVGGRRVDKTEVQCRQDKGCNVNKMEDAVQTR